MLKERKPNRLRDYDYSQPGYYFITICTHHNKVLFGEVIKNKMNLNNYGKIVSLNWLKIPEIYNNVDLDEFVIMPNHMHGIIIINAVGTTNFVVPTDDRKKMLLSNIIQQFKRKCTIDIRSKFNYNQNIWQRSYYDRIIRNQKELYQIRKYMFFNPLRWEIEKSIPENYDY